MAFHFANTPESTTPLYVDATGPHYYDQGSGTVSGNLDPQGKQGLTDQLVGNLKGALKGELPPDVVQQIQQNAAEFGVAGGVPGSQFAGYQGLKNLGLTSLNRMQGAESELVNPLLGYHPLQVVPPVGPPIGGAAPVSNPNWARNIMPGGITGIAGAGQQGGGGGRTPLPLMDPRGQQNQAQATIAEIGQKYGPGSASSSFGFGSPMGTRGTLPTYGSVGGGSMDVAGGYQPWWSQDQTDQWLNAPEGNNPVSGGYMYTGPDYNAPPTVPFSPGDEYNPMWSQAQTDQWVNSGSSTPQYASVGPAQDMGYADDWYA